ncbi:biopolymer transporter ExbD [Thalassospira profundimaris]|uniref:Biopolymer transporter ExbD n=1 Tax=Thalassospira profundimaris TaxID=502049 RepID=A0A367WCL7_9PROT|nr:biopolymer transporter ExbD [Thalassospira profundimaris]RCK39168.1 biopolymer transporter ExbD [Thalassospira profundimaris]
MKRRIQITDDTMAQEPMLPLINIVFLLLIFFMIAGSLQKLGPFDVDPPSSADAMQRDDETVVLWVDKSGKMGVDDRQGALNDIAGLLPEGFAQHPIEIRADRNVDGQMIVALLKRLQELHVDKVQLMTAVEAQN